MESPHQQLLAQQEASYVEFDDGPSSPFMTEVGGQSRVPSKQWTAPSPIVVAEDQTMDIFATPMKSAQDMALDSDTDKENLQQDQSGYNVLVSPRKPTTSHDDEMKVQLGIDQDVRSHAESELMPPPSVRKTPITPRRSPLKQLQRTATTPRPLSHEDSLGRSGAQSASSFQRGLDLRTSQLPAQDQANVDDTCFSAFSEIPEMTLFAKLGQSPTRRADMTRSPGRNTEATPRTSRKRSSPSRSPSPTPRRLKTPATTDDGNTTFLIDFTQQFESVSGYKQTSPSKSATEPDLLRYVNSQRSPNKTTRQSYATPSKPNSLLNLLDFELPPAPTPRSVPTITVRELESLKSSYLSQISSLKATLSGREAEVESLKRAVGDAERRVGEAQESLREEKSKREHVEQEKAEWEKRGHDVENVLKSVKEEVMKSEAEKEDLISKAEDCERRAEDAEARAVKAEERFADALAARAETSGGDGAASDDQVQKLVAAQIDSKIEAVSRELHSVYKEKHERKVATLKKSYEARSEKKCAELQSRLTELENSNKELEATRDATFSGPMLDVSGNDAELKAQLEEQTAHIARLVNEMQTLQQQQEQLMHELRQERIEKGDLVAAVDEMLALQAEQGSTPGAMSVVEDFRKSITRGPGLRVPGSIPAPGESKIGRGLTRPAPAGNKSKMLANIERMGRTASGGSTLTNEQ